MIYFILRVYVLLACMYGFQLLEMCSWTSEECIRSTETRLKTGFNSATLVLRTKSWSSVRVTSAVNS